jgi:hypothetical protein
VSRPQDVQLVAAAPLRPVDVQLAVDSFRFGEMHPNANQNLVNRLAEALRRKRQQRLLLLLGGLDG